MLEKTIEFLNEHLLECEPNQGCGRCDELREHIEILKKAQNQLNIADISSSTMTKWGKIVTLEKEIDNICKLCKYGEFKSAPKACYTCAQTLELRQYYR